MPTDSAALLVHCQIALRLTQEQLGELLGRTKRTIQRWQDQGFEPMADQAETLAQALQPVRPDLAEQVLELARKVALRTGGTPAPPATAEVIDAILQAAAGAGGTSPEAIRPAVTAAFLEAAEAGVEVSAVVAGLGAGR
jgi:transcriptional regulator with XRE-family HTH domain